MAILYLSDDGMLYSHGRDDKKTGILGLSYQYEAKHPCPNNNLIDYRINKVAIGATHACALTSGGQLFTWGSG